jgi:hypothetical protein
MKVRVNKRSYDRALGAVNWVRTEMGLRPVTKFKVSRVRMNTDPIAQTIRHGWKGKGRVQVDDSGTICVGRVGWDNEIVLNSTSVADVLDSVLSALDTDTCRDVLVEIVKS